MKQVYSAQHPMEAHILKGILETQGISCKVRGEVLFSARGEIPMTNETAPSVWIEEDQLYDKARAIVREYEEALAADPVSQETWQCSACGEKSEAQFTHCWNCGGRR